VAACGGIAHRIMARSSHRISSSPAAALAHRYGSVEKRSAPIGGVASALTTSRKSAAGAAAMAYRLSISWLAYGSESYRALHEKREISAASWLRGA